MGAKTLDAALVSGRLLVNLDGTRDTSITIGCAGSAHTFARLIQFDRRGSGMSEQVLANALLPFYSTKRSGTGLGLSLCREIAEAHGGRISLANRPDGGLAVSVWLPQRATG